MSTPTIKETLVLAGKYKEIEELLSELLLRESDYPIYPQIAQSQQSAFAKYCITVEDVQRGVTLWYKCCEVSGEQNLSSEEYLILSRFLLMVSNLVTNELVDYAIQAAYSYSKPDIRPIRNWLILKSSVEDMLGQFYDFENNRYVPWSIPEVLTQS